MNADEIRNLRRFVEGGGSLSPARAVLVLNALESAQAHALDRGRRALAAESRVAAALAECADWRDWTGTGNERESALVKCAVETVAVKLRGEVG